jgi:hypothetical protein
MMVLRPAVILGSEKGTLLVLMGGLLEAVLIRLRCQGTRLPGLSRYRRSIAQLFVTSVIS